jgi:hypothetical protein
VKELTSNLEEAGRQSSSCSPQDSVILRQLVAELLLEMGSRSKDKKGKGYSSENGPELFVVSNEFRQQMVATIFEWIYHSGIR